MLSHPRSYTTLITLTTASRFFLPTNKYGGATTGIAALTQAEWDLSIFKAGGVGLLYGGEPGRRRPLSFCFDLGHWAGQTVGAAGLDVYYISTWTDPSTWASTLPTLTLLETFGINTNYPNHFARIELPPCAGIAFNVSTALASATWAARWYME
jgi:hypothetical protein